MAGEFYNGAKGFTAQLNKPEKDFIRNLLVDVIELISTENSSDDELADLVGISDGKRPEDPVLQRLFPDGVKDSEAEATEFRKLSEMNVKERKLSQLRNAVKLLSGEGPLVLKPDEAMDFAAALNSVRIVIATRLDIKDEVQAEQIQFMLDFNDVKTNEDYLIVTYNFLSWLQDSLMQAMLKEM
ncbi:MAG: DUF2017 domain-containing protein [Micrococcaceae bacterium]